MARRSGGSESSGGASDELVGWSTLVVGLAVCLTLLYKNGVWAAFRAKTYMGFDEYYLFNISLLTWPAMLLILLVLKRELSEFGLTPGDRKGGLIFTLLSALCFVPGLAFFSRLPEFQNYYLARLQESGALVGMRSDGTHWIGGTLDYGRLFYHETVMGFYMFVWEWFFRGFMLFGLRKIMPTWAAAIVQMIPFFILHLGKPAGEFWLSMLGGLALVPIAIRFKSMLPCFTSHLLLSLGNDIAVLWVHFR